MPDLADHLAHLLDTLERRYEVGIDHRPPVATGLRALDALVDGVPRGGWLIRSGAGLGSTSVVVGFLLGLAVGPRRPAVQLVTTDLPPYELTLRLVATAGTISLDHLRSEHLDPAEWRRLPHAVRAIAGADVRITDARGWSAPQLEMWCSEHRPIRSEQGWLVIDRLDRLSHAGVVSLPRLERISGRQVVATTRHVNEHVRAAALVTTIAADEQGYRELVVDRPDVMDTRDRTLGLSVHASTLQVWAYDAPRPGPGQLRLDGFGGPGGAAPRSLSP